jgi:histidyl-tRNA synthetase
VIITEKDEASMARAIAAAASLRARGIGTEIAFAPGFKNGLKYANRVGAVWAVLANVDGLVLKNLGDGSQADVALDDLAARLLG